MRLPNRVLSAGLVGVLTLTTLVAADITAAAATATFTPTADTYVADNAPTSNFGTAGAVGVDASEVNRTFLKFTVSGVSGTVTSAKLRLHTDTVAGSESDSGGTWKLMSNTGWSETGVTWNNQPAIDGATLGSIGAVAVNTWYEIDVTSQITGNGTFSIGGTSTSTNGADFDSRETGATAPQLVVSTDVQSGDPVWIGAGDIADSGSQDTNTANLVSGIAGTVWTTGDNVYPNGTASEFNTYYNPTWGAFKNRTRPVPGNHDYNTSGYYGYYGYFGAAAGTAGQGYYSYDLGNWHIVALNSEISTTASSAQATWLTSDLAGTTKPCIAAYWHKPRFTSGSTHGNNTAIGPLVQILYNNHADVVVTGHNHQYERFNLLNPSGAVDTTGGIRHFVVGTGGAGLYPFGTIQPGSQVRNNNSFGALKFTLHANSYDWNFLPAAGSSFTDSGTTNCH
ncbi:DNRLRE domain-containing protein [Pseudonocardiaceae bacterium YIM PH 21723]|nr:DNRLRE domain-containing protein [Pseudonocardiaceae bacterium YIM PH 21723]